MILYPKILLFLLLVILCCSCSATSPQVDYRANLKNVILIVIDTLAADNLTFMGYDRPTSPFMDELAGQSIVFNRAYSPKALTLPAFASIFSGLHPIAHNVQENGQIIPDDIHMLAQDFWDTGFQTIGFAAADPIRSRYHIDRGFEYYYDDLPRPQIRAAEVVDLVSGFLNNEPGQGSPDWNENEPLFLFIHLYDPHTPYEPEPQHLNAFADPDYNGPVTGDHSEFSEYNHKNLEFDDYDHQHARDRYDGEIHMVDHYLRTLFSLFDEFGLTENSVILLTADHGENLGEHRFYGHGHPYEQGLHVPFLLHLPGNMGSGIRIDAPVEITDTVPTLMDLLNIPIPENLDGMSVVPLFENLDNPDIVSRDYVLGVGPVGTDEHRNNSIFDGQYRLTKTDEEMQLYDIINDPHEENNLADSQPDILNDLYTVMLIMSAGEKPPEDIEMDPETEEMLRSLGYLN